MDYDKEIAKLNQVLLDDVKDFVEEWENNAGAAKVLWREIYFKYADKRVPLDLKKIDAKHKKQEEDFTKRLKQ